MNTTKGHISTTTLVTRLSLLLALVVGLTPVIAYWEYSYTRLTTQLEGNLEIQAAVLTDFITAQPDTWDVATDRLLGSLDRYISHEKGFRVYDAQGMIVVQAAPTIKGPFITRSHPIYAFGHPVGRIEGQDSLLHYLLIGLAVFGASLICAWLLWVPIRGLPLAALAAAERELRTRDRYQRTLLDNSPFLVWLKDLESRYLAVNTKFLEVADQPSDENLIGKADAKIALSGLAAKLRGDDQDVLANGQPKRVEEWVEDNGQRRCFEIYKSPVSLDGQVIGIVGCAQEITERKMLEAQLLQSQKLEAIGHLAAGIAHEINTPAQYVGDNVQFIKSAFEDVLSVCGKVRQLVQAAKDAPPTLADMEALAALMAERDIDYLEAEVPAAIAQTLEGVEHISTIVRSVKQFAHPGAAVMASADLNEAMQNTATVSRNEWKYVADLDTDLDENLPLVICMIGEINQVVLNLIINAAHVIADAIKKDPERKGRITLTTKLAPPWAEIRVTDSGTGIPPDVQTKVFNPFFTTKEVGTGTGQGLAIARSIVVERHKGQLFFETEAGVGTTFVVRLPLEQAGETP